MIKLRVHSPLSVLWRPGSEQWSLRTDAGGEATVPVRETPFVIGRAADCQLLLPESPDLDKTTSRWHCHIVEEDGRPLLVDGSWREVPGRGARKPSITGTWVNGDRIGGPRELKAGDEIAVGPWTFGVEESEERPVDIDAGLKKLGAGKPRELPAGHPRVREGFARLHELTQKVNRTSSIEENLVSILNCAVSEAGCAEVAALLVDESDDRCRTRIAWQRGVGRVSDFRFSADLVRRLPKDRGFLWVNGVQDGAASRREEKIDSAILVPLWGNEERLGILYLDNRQSGVPFTEEDLYLANALASCATLQLLREKEVFLMRVASSMSQYFGPDIVRLLVEEANQGRAMLPEVKEQTATMLFVDLTGFSRFCRGRSPREVSELLNPYLQLVAECIQRHSGHVDKFIGDGVLGVFGALPLAKAPPDADHARQAVRAAREIISLWAKQSNRVIQILLPIRAGINTGRVVVGNIGFAGRMEYSVIGDPVNLASRMEKLALPNGIALTDATRGLLGDEFECVDAGMETVKGFGAVRVWRVSGPAA
jgi:class 3 adenylate cyclase